MAELESIFIAILTVGALTNLLLYRYKNRQLEIEEQIKKQAQEELVDSLRKFIGASTKASKAQKKKDAIMRMGPKTFYYLDESQVKDLYPQAFQEREPTRIETRESKGTKKGISAKFEVISPKYERDSAQEKTEIYDIKQNPPIMYNKVEKYLFKGDKVKFGLEEFEFEESQINEVNSLFDKMRNEHKLNISKDMQDKIVSDKMKEFALQNVEKLSTSSGYVAIQTEFSVIEIYDGIYLLSFSHPLNDHLPQEETNVRIQVTCAKKYMCSSGESIFKKGKLLKITCVGKVVSWNDQDKILEINPIAIY